MAQAEALLAAGDEERADLPPSALALGSDLWRAAHARADRHYQDGNWEAAEAAARLTLRVAARLADPLGQSFGRRMLGVLHAERGEPDAAERELAASRQLLEAHGLTEGLANVLNSQAIVATNRGRFDEAAALYERAARLAEEAGDGVFAGRILANLGSLHLNRGDLKAATAWLRRAELLAPREVAVPFNLAAVHENQGELDLALDYYRKALAIDVEDGALADQADDLSAIGNVLARRGEREAALVHFARAMALLEKLGASERLILTENALGDLHLSAGRPARALEHYERALRRAQEADDRLSMIDPHIGAVRAHLALGEHEPALALARRGCELAEALGAENLLSEAFAALGETLRAAGRVAEAEQAFLRSVALAERGRDLAAGGELGRLGFLESRLDRYHALVELRFTQGRFEEALAAAEQARGRVLLDILRHGRTDLDRVLSAGEREELQRLERRLEDSRAAARTGEVDSLRRELAALRARLYGAHPELQLAHGAAPLPALESIAARRLGPGTALVAFAATRGRLYRFVVTAEGGTAGEARRHRLTAAAIEVGAAELSRRVEAFRARLAARDLDLSSEARDLYRLLFRGAERLIETHPRLVVVPDGALWELPLQALEWAPGRVLAERASVLLAPSLTALVELGAPRAPARAGRRRPWLGFGDPRPSPPGLPSLADSARQLRRVHALYGGEAGSLFLGALAREERLRSEAPQARVLHLATHGVLDRASPLYSYLALAHEDASQAEDGRLEAHEVLSLRLSADLVVLASCESARGRIGAGEGLVGMAWAWLLAGSRNVVVGQWKVDAAATDELMLAFHRSLRSAADQGEPGDVAGALREAALRLRRDPRFRHPFYWAGFVAVGEGTLPGRA